MNLDSILAATSPHGDAILAWRESYEKKFGKTDHENRLYEQRVGYLPLLWFTRSSDRMYNTPMAQQCHATSFFEPSTMAGSQARVDVLIPEQGSTKPSLALDGYGVVFGSLLGAQTQCYVQVQHWNTALKSDAAVLIGIVSPTDKQMVMPEGYAALTKPAWEAWKQACPWEQFSDADASKILRYAVALERYRPEDYSKIIEKINSIDVD